MTVTDKQITKIKIAADESKVIICFNNLIKTDTPNGTEEEEDEEDSSLISNEYQIKGKHRPNQEFLDAMKGMRKLTLEACEISVDSKELPTWTVSGIKIAGDVFLKKSRVVLTLAKTVKRTGKVIELNSPQITMYPEQDDLSRFHAADKLSKLIEEVIEHAWDYLNGNYGDEDPAQLPLFQTAPKLQTKFDK